jgi:hypothetical protein
MNRPKLAISFSGGRTSAMMTYLCLKKYDATHDIQITFANTGCEHEETLRFVDAVDRNFANGRVVWIEAIIGPKGVGPRARIVDYKTASRSGEPFEEAIKKHGVFCKTHPQCTSRLKVEPIQSYLRDQGWMRGEYDTAVGIRADEVDRISKNASQNRIIYPLVQERITKQDVKRFMSQFDWDLKLPGEHYGNCVWCWKKSRRKLATVAKYTPEFFDFPARMEEQYGHVHNSAGQQEKDRTFFRGRTSAKQIVEIGRSGNFKEYVERDFVQQDLFNEFDEDWDVGGGCGDSCEIGADDYDFNEPDGEE